LDKWYNAASDEDYFKYGQEAFQFYSDQLVVIGIVGYCPEPIIVKNRLKNVWKTGFMGSSGNNYKTILPELWYLEA